jgi:hypothetical protein
MSCRRAQVGNALKDHNRWHNRRAARAKSMSSWKGDLSNVMAEATADVDRKETPLPRTVTFRAAAVLMLWWVVGALMADAWPHA